MDCDDVAPQDLFDKPFRYAVPLFQRPYVWSRDKQWEPLWEDIRRTADGLDALIAGGMAEDKALKTADRHFLGAIVIQAMSNSSKYIQARSIIDGQQRLTTLQVLLHAAKAIMADIGLAQEAAILDGMVNNEEKYWASDHDRFKLWPTNLDRQVYSQIMTAGMTPVNYGTLVDPSAPLVGAHKFFHEQIGGWVREEDAHEKRERRARSLVLAIRELVRVVEITLKEHENAQVIFETLNDRGEPLQASDLVKNLIFQEVEQAGGDSESLYAEYWQPFDTAEWRAKVAQGRLFRPRVDLFLQHWLVLRTLSDVSSANVFLAFRKSAMSDGAAPKALLKDLHANGVVWSSLDTVDPFSKLGTFNYRQRTMQASSLGPVLLWLLNPASPTPEMQVHLALEAIESWMVRRMVCRLTTKDYNSLYIELLDKLVGVEPAERGTAVWDFLAGQEADSRFWPSDRQVHDAFATLPLYRLLTRARLRMVLEALEDELRENKTEEHVPRGKLTIEHVMPQGWNDTSWPLHPEEDETVDDAASRRNGAIQTIGNLTLLTQSLNSSVSHGPWVTKRQGLEEYGVLRLSSDLKKSEVWDESTIRRRASRLAAVACTVWPTPASAGGA